MDILFSFFLGYLLGSIPFGILFSHLFSLGDLRSFGSGNIGATNVLRTGNKLAAALTLLLDIVKSMFAIFLVSYFSYILFPVPSIFGFYIFHFCALGVFLGHLYPIWLGFRGGKGVSVYVGLTLAFSWQGFFIFAFVWLFCSFIFRISSLSSLLATLVIPIYFWFFSDISVFGLFLLLSILCWFVHRLNILRLIRGEESKIVL